LASGSVTGSSIKPDIQKPSVGAEGFCLFWKELVVHTVLLDSACKVGSGFRHFGPNHSAIFDLVGLAFAQDRNTELELQVIDFKRFSSRDVDQSC
jgi:hypothetical protein